MLSGVVQVVGGEKRSVDCPCNFQQLRVALSLLGYFVVLEFYEQVVAAENVLEARCPVEGMLVVTLKQRLLHDAA